MIQQATVLPLEQFPSAERTRIQALVSAHRPPPRFVHIGDPARPTAQIESRAWYEWFWQRGLTPERQPIGDATRKAVFKRDGRRCRYCGDIGGPFALDHVQPRVQGGRDTADNLVVSCRSCNGRKGGRTPEQAGMTLLPMQEASS